VRFLLTVARHRPHVPACQLSAVSQLLDVGKGVQPTPSSVCQFTVPPTIRRISLSCPPMLTATMWSMMSRNLFAAATLRPYRRGACLQSTLAPARCLHLCLSSQATSASARTHLRSGGPCPITSRRTMFGGHCGKKPSLMWYVAVSRLCAALIRCMLTNFVLGLPCHFLHSVRRMRRYHFTVLFQASISAVLRVREPVRRIRSRYWRAICTVASLATIAWSPAWHLYWQISSARLRCWPLM
jgi:hypothetical protein